MAPESTDIQRRVGQRIKELRRASGESQEHFANRIEMARTYFTEVENGKRNPSLNNLEKIAKGLGKSLKEFFDSDRFA